MLSHVQWRDFVHVNCISNSFTDASTGSCRVLLCIFVHGRRLVRGSADVKVGSSNWFKSFSRSELMVLATGLAVLDSYFRPPLISHRHTLHSCKVRRAMCRPALQAPTSSLDNRDVRKSWKQGSPQHGRKSSSGSNAMDERSRTGEIS